MTITGQVPVHRGATGRVNGGSGTSFALVTTLEDFKALTAQGVDSILLTRRSNSHFSVPLLVRLAGPCIVPWRWRRILLNEGIDVVVLPWRVRSAPLALGALLARSRVTVPARRHTPRDRGRAADEVT